MEINFFNIFFTIILCLSIFIVSFIFYRYLQGSNRLEERLDAVIQTKTATIGNQQSALGGVNQNNGGVEGFFNLNSAIAQFVLGMTKNVSRQYQLQFEQAGFPNKKASTIVLLIKTGSFILSLLLCIILYVFQDIIAPQNLILRLFTYVGIIILGLKGYDIVINFMIKKRYERIQRTLSFSVDLLSICVRGGYSLDRSFEIIAEEVSYYNIDLCVEFMKVSIELSVIPDRKEALRNLARRLDLPLTKILVSGLIQSEEQGASMAQTLTHLSQDFNKQKLSEIDEIATKIPVKILIPMGLFCLPGFLLFVMGPLVAGVTRSSIMNI